MLGADLGLDFSTGRETFELHGLRLAEKIGSDNQVKCHLILQLLQHRDEATPHRIAWAAVKRSYQKVGDIWIRRDELPENWV